MYMRCYAIAIVGTAATAAAIAALLHAQERRRKAAWAASVRITRGSIEDARSRIGSLRPLVEECFPALIEDEGDEDTLSLLCGFYEPADCIVLFADDDAGLCGLALLFPVRSARESSLYISTVCVRTSCQRRGLGGRIMRTASTVAAAEGLPTLAGAVQASERARLVPFYERLGGTLRADSACAGSGATVFTLRLEAPSGPVTSLGAASPRRFSTDGNLEGAARAKGENGPRPRELDTTVSAFYHY